MWEQVLRTARSVTAASTAVHKSDELSAVAFVRSISTRWCAPSGCVDLAAKRPAPQLSGDQRTRMRERCGLTVRACYASAAVRARASV
jgi:hypothetical protein